MSSSARIDGALITPGAGPDVTTVFSGGWSVGYDWAATPDRVVTAGAPRQIAFPPPFNRDLAGALPGQATFAAFQYVFKDDKYLRLRLSDGLPDGPPADTAPNWGLPRDWTVVDAVFPGGGVKSRFAYFFRGDEYCRFDWVANAISPNYPKKFGPNWHTTSDFAAGIDGEITGRRSFGTKAYLFRTATTVVDNNGHPVAPGASGKTVSTPVYARYDYDSEKFEFTITDPVQVVTQWPGLLPLLDAGAATDVAVDWVDRTVRALGGPLTPAIVTAFGHHFAMTGTIDTTVVRSRLGEILSRLRDIPNKFRWTPGLAFPAQTAQGVLTEIGDEFSTFHGPNGRAAALIHEAVHFTFGAGPDIPEWSGATVGGVTYGVATDPLTGAPLIAYADLTTSAALTNPSSYAAFAQEVALGTDIRYGAGRPQE